MKEHRKISFNSKPMLPNVWDMLVFVVVFAIIIAVLWGQEQMTLPFHGNITSISLEPSLLPGYAVNTVMRMFIALFFSFATTFIVAPLAAKNYQIEKIIIPLIDIMQSIPVIGMLAITTLGFLKLFPNSRLGPESAAIFAIFTSQVWNMLLSLYQSLRVLPHELLEASKMFHLNAWQRFWKVELPFATPNLLWNTMVSMSAGWFLVVASEAIIVSKQTIYLPGIGSYIHLAILQSDIYALGYAILTMFFVIFLYDQLLFRPLLAWSEKFKAEIDDELLTQESWFLDVLAKTNLFKYIKLLYNKFTSWFIAAPKTPNASTIKFLQSSNVATCASILWNTVIFTSLILCCWIVYDFVSNAISYTEVIKVIFLGSITSLKVIVLIIFSSIIWIPIGTWIGLNPKACVFIQPVIQFLAAFPPNFFYPLAVLAISKYGLQQDLWTMPLMILGSQWYILFNVISGASIIPKEIKMAAKNFGVTGWLWWRRILLPAIFPAYVTGALAAAGGCWNASIVAEYIQWGDKVIISQGLGAYITEYSRLGDVPRIVLGIFIMCLYVMLFNRCIWNKLYQLAETKFKLE